MGKWKILGIVDEGVNDDIYILLEYWGFHGRNVDKFWVCLSGLLRILLNLRKLVIVLDSHSIPFVLDHFGLTYPLDVFMGMLLHHKQKKRGRIARATILSCCRPNKKKRPKKKRTEGVQAPTHTRKIYPSFFSQIGKYGNILGEITVVELKTLIIC